MEGSEIFDDVMKDLQDLLSECPEEMRGTQEHSSLLKLQDQVRSLQSSVDPFEAMMALPGLLLRLGDVVMRFAQYDEDGSMREQFQGLLDEAGGAAFCG